MNAALRLGAWAALACSLTTIPATVRADRAAVEEEPAPPKVEDPVSAADRETKEKAELALSQGRVDEACVLFESLTRSEQPLALIDAGKCFAIAGKTASAYKRYTRASIAAASRGEVGLEDRARDLASKLVPTLSKLRVDVLGATQDLVVTINGAPMPRSEWGVLGHADPGTLAVRATADGKAPFETSLTLGPNGDAQVLVIPALKAPSEVQEPPPVVPPPQVTPERTEKVSPIGIAAFVTTAFGVVGLGTGIAFGVMTLSEVAEAEENPSLCPNKVCSEAGRAIVDEAETKGIISTAMFVFGGATLATGGTLFLLRELGVIDHDEPKEPSAAPTVSISPVSIGATWRF